MNKKMKIALAQTHIVWEDKEANYKKASECIKEAANQGTKAIFFPEMSFTGFSMNTDITVESSDETIMHMKKLAVEYDVHIGFGWVKNCGELCENHYTIVDNLGNIISDYAKLHPFSYSGEDKKFKGGEAVSQFDINGITCSSFICYDLRFPEIFQISSNKAHVIILPANWPARRGEHWKALLKARAIENQVYILAINCVGEIGGIDYKGDSCVINPNGDVQASLSGKEGNIYFELEDDTQSFRSSFPVKQDRRENLYKKLRDTALLCLMVCFISGFMVGCSSYTSTDKVQNEAYDNESPKNTVHSGIYDSEDAAVVVKKDLEAKTIQLQNIATSKRYTLNYDGTTKLYDKNEQSLSMPQLKEGSVVTVRFYKQDKSLVYAKENPDCVSYSNVQNYDMDLKNGTMTIGSEVYNISGHVVVSSGGREADMMEVNSVDVISVWGYKNMIYGINVERGHGYLRLQNEDYFVGGWLDIGDRIIRKISEDMLIVVPEGTFNVMVSNKGSSASQEISFARNEEMAWDLGDVEITVVQRGSIIFTLTPATAKVYIDGREVNVSKPVTLDYGLHQMRITADGYDTVAQYIKVAEPSANVSVELEKSEEASSETDEKSSDDKDSDDKDSDDKTSDDKDSEDEATRKKYQSNSQALDDDKSDNEESDEKSDEKSDDEQEESSSSSKKDTVSADSKYRVYIDAPEGVEAYIDGSYAGITPVNFAKKAGSYVVTLRKTGYQTRSYTLQIDNEEKDVNYSFTELTKLE